MAGGAIRCGRLVTHILEYLTTMALDTSFHIKIFTAIDIFENIPMATRARNSCGRMNSMMKNNMLWKG